MLYILYNKSRAIWWLVPVRQPVGWYARDSNLRVAPVKWHAICNTCYIYYTTNRVPCDDLYLSGNQSDDIYVRVAYLRVASVKWHATNTHTHICILYNKSHAICGIYLSDSTCPTTFRLYVRDDNHSVVSVKYPSDYMRPESLIKSPRGRSIKHTVSLYRLSLKAYR